jgi:hypothetical protein
MFQIGEVLTHYEVTAVLPRALNAEQYRARQSKTGVDMLLRVYGPKVIPSAEERQDFINRQARAYNVRHPNAAPLADIFQHGGHVVLVTPFLPSPTLAETLRRGRIPRGDAWQIFEHIASAVSQFHQQELMVGDLIPELIHVAPGSAMLVSFGTGTLLPRKTHLASMEKVGRLRWQAPEVRLGRAFSARSDMYALGCLAHEVLYGRGHPFSDGIRRGGFAKFGRWLSQGGVPKKGPAVERWPRIDQQLAEALSGYMNDRPFDIETFVDTLRKTLAASPMRPSEMAGVPAVPPPPSAPPPMSAPPPAYVPPSSAANASARTMGGPQSSPPPSAPAYVPPAPAEQPRTMMAQAATVPASAAEQPRTMMAQAPMTPPPQEQPRTMMAQAPMAPAPPPQEQPRTMMAQAPMTPPPQEQPHTMMAPMPSAAKPQEQRTQAMTAPTPEMLASLAPAPRPQRPSIPPVAAAPPPAAPAPPPAAPAAPFVSPVVKAPESANATRPVDVASIQDLLRASASSSGSPNEKKTSEIDANEVARLLGEMKNPKE